MPKPIVTVDFHNTLVECDEWFELEVRTLVSAVLDWSERNYLPLTVPVNRRLVDSEYRKLRLAIHVHGHEVDAERSVAVVLERFGLFLPAEIISTAVGELMRASFQHAQPVPGALRFLRELQAHGARLAVVSIAVYHPFLEWALDSFSMKQYLEAVVTSASSGFYKSRPEIYWAALQRLNSEPADAAHIGDSLRFDVGGAAAAGMRTVWFDRDGSRSRSQDSAAPDLVVTELESAANPVLGLVRRSRSSFAGGRFSENGR